MILQLHTPKGIIEVDTEAVTDKQLVELNVSRDSLNELVPRDLAAEIDMLKAKVEKLEKKQWVGV